MRSHRGIFWYSLGLTLLLLLPMVLTVAFFADQYPVSYTHLTLPTILLV